MTTYPVIETIGQKLATALEAIDGTGSYRNTAAEVVRPRRTGENVNIPASALVLYPVGKSREYDLDVGGGDGVDRIGWRASYLVDAHIALSESSETPMEQVFNSWEADIERALMVDDTLDGYAMRVELTGTDYADGDSGLAIVTVSFDVVYEAIRTDPDTKSRA